MENNIKFRRLGTMLDCSKNAVMSVPSVKRWIDLTSDMGYNMVMLYTEDTYEVDNQPFFGYMRGRYSQKELREIEEYALSKNMEFIPAIQTLAHLGCIFRYWRYNTTVRDCNDILLAEEEKTYELIDDMFSSLEKTLRTRIVNIGMDEAHMIGKGTYFDKHGYKDKYKILMNHLEKVAEIAKKHGFECIMWADMFFRMLGSDYLGNDGQVPENVKKRIPDNVNLILWDYYSDNKEHYIERIKAHNAAKENIWFAGGLWGWIGYAPHNVRSIKNTVPALEACISEGVQDIILTTWGDDGAEGSKFALIPSLYYAAQIAQGINDLDTIKKGFYEKFGISFDDFMLVDLPETANDTNTVNNNNNAVLNPDKYMLFNDCLVGLYDTTVRDDDAERYAKCSQKLREFENYAEYGYIFKSLRMLCDVLAVKYDIGIRARKAYNSKNISVLKEIVSELEKLLELIENFYCAYRKQWMYDNKPFGFEVQDIRIGGLSFRVRHAMEKIEAYVDGKISTIEEFDQPLLDVTEQLEGFYQYPIATNNWKQTVSVNVI